MREEEGRRGGRGIKRGEGRREIGMIVEGWKKSGANRVGDERGKAKQSMI